MTTGARIRHIRMKAGLTQKDLADKLKISPANIVQWENGIRNPKLETIKRIAVALNVDYTDLLDPNSDPNNFTPEQNLQRAVVKLTHSMLLYEDAFTMYNRPITPEQRERELTERASIISSNFGVSQEELLNEWHKTQMRNLSPNDQLIRETIELMNSMNLDGRMALLHHARELAQIPSYQNEVPNYPNET